MRGNDVFVVELGGYWLVKRTTFDWTRDLTQIHLFYSYDEADKTRAAADAAGNYGAIVQRLR